jgi:hypothetical protein
MTVNFRIQFFGYPWQIDHSIAAKDLISEVGALAWPLGFST